MTEVDIEVKYHQIQVNVKANGEREIVFPYGGKWYRMNWSDVPDTFKEMYVADLKLHGYSIPDDLIAWDEEFPHIGDAVVFLDLTKAEEVGEGYPMV